MNKAPEIPGFYYDEEKNRYFKIPATGLPDKIIKRQMTKNKIIKPKTFSENINRIIKNHEIGKYKKHTIFEKNILSAKLVTLSLSKADTILDATDNEIKRFCNIVSSPLNDSLLLYQTRNQIPEIWRLTNVNNNLKKDLVFTKSKGLIASLNYCDTPRNGALFVLAEDYNSTTVVQTCGSDILNEIRVCSKKAIPTCAWSEKNIAYSRDKVAVYHGVTSGHTQCQDIITKQVFSRNGNLLYNGLKNGKTTAISLRSRKHIFNFKPGNEYKTIVDLHILREGNLIVTRNVSKYDALFLWDQRMLRKPVLQYISIPHSYHKNTEKNLQIDAKEQFLTCINVDEVVRIWDIQTGNLVSFILPENEPITAHYQDNWPLFHHIPGILCVGKQSILWYGDKTN